MTHLVNDADNVVGGISDILTKVIRETLTIIFLVITMFVQNPRLAVCGLIGFTLVFVPIIKISKKLKTLTKATQMNLQKFVSQINDTMDGIKVVKSYNAESFETKRIGGILQDIFKMRKKVAIIGNISSPLVECASVIGIAMVIWYGGSQVIAGSATPGAFFAFFAAITIAYKPAKSLAGINVTFQFLLASARRVMDVTDQSKLKAIDNTGKKSTILFQESISFKNITFSYPNSEITSLKEVSFSIKKGQKVAFVGLSGSGKSTIINLILRLYTPKSGQILIDNNDVLHYTDSAIRNLISFVSQDVILFYDTIENNIKYVKTSATREQVINAAKVANAEEFINTLPNNYDTVLQGAGSELSGGQKQRISIARAILRDAPILIFDEATSALDTISEKAITSAINTLSQEKTTILIAHRLSTVINADIIYVIDQGSIVESGSHNELLTRNGKYAALYHTQFS